MSIGNILFAIVTFIYILHWIGLLKKDMTNISTYAFAGVIFPCILYLCNWSNFIIEEPSPVFFYIMIVFELLIIFSNIVSKTKLGYKKSIRINIKKNNLNLDLYNIIFLCCVLLENYLLCRSLFPALSGIDIHASSVPVISFVTNSLYPFMFCDLLGFLVTKKKKYIVYYFLIILVLFVGKGARMQVLMSIVCTLSFFAYYLKDISKGTLRSVSKTNSARDKKLYKKWKYLAIILSLGLIYLMAYYTEYRMNQFGKYNLTFATEIGYKGPITNTFIDLLIIIYYGYFPLSFNNLNVNLKYMNFKHNCIGLYSYKSFYFGFLQLDNILGLNSYQPERSLVYKTSGSATVPTAFIDYFYDYSYLFFIPVIVHLIICIYYKQKYNRKPSVFSLAMYYLFVPITFFLSFQNIVFSSFMIWQIIILYYMTKRFFYVIEV